MQCTNRRFRAALRPRVLWVAAAALRPRVLWVAAAALCVLGGCAIPHTPATPHSPELESDPVTGRQFFLYVPSMYREETPSPLIITCHGTPPFDVAEHHIKTWKWYGEQNNCIVVAPKLDATDGILGDGPLVGMLSNEKWILSIVSSLSYRYNIDRANVMITGFSGGGFPTYWIGLRHPDIFHCIVAQGCNFSRPNLDGWWPREAKASKLFIYFGSNDPGTIVAQSRRAVEYFQEKGFPHLETRELSGTGHERRPDLAMEFFRKHWRAPRPSMPQAGSAALR